MALTVTNLESSVQPGTELCSIPTILDEDTGPFHRVAWPVGGTLVAITQFPDLKSTEPFDERRPGLENSVSGQQRRRLVNDLAGFVAVLHVRATLGAGARPRGPLSTPAPQATTTEIRARFGKPVKLSQ